MPVPAQTALEELRAILARYDREIDEPDAIPFIARIREERIIGDREWKDVLCWVDQAMTYLADDTPEDEDSALMVDADPRNADWTRIARAQRLAGYRMPHWASLWIWWIGHDREEGEYWKQIRRMAKAMGFPRFKEGRQRPES